MAKIIKVGSQNLTPNKIANPFKTSRNSTTNPFKYSNFEGNTLRFADVFEGFEPQKVNKMKMIASSVAGSVHKVRAGITEPIVNFVNRVREGISSAWDYAKNTNISDVAGIKNISDAMSGIGTRINDRFSAIHENISSIGDKVSSRMGFLNTDVTDIAKSVADKWTNMISKIQINKPFISADASVAELEQLWKNEIAMEGAV